MDASSLLSGVGSAAELTFWFVVNVMLVLSLRDTTISWEVLSFASVCCCLKNDDEHDPLATVVDVDAMLEICCLLQRCYCTRLLALVDIHGCWLLVGRSACAANGLTRMQRLALLRI